MKSLKPFFLFLFLVFSFSQEGWGGLFPEEIGGDKIRFKIKDQFESEDIDRLIKIRDRNIKNAGKKLYIPVVALDLSNSKMGDDNVIRLAKEVLPGLSDLTELNLSDCSIDVGGAKELAKFLEKNTSLVKLVLSHNGISDEGVGAFAEALKWNHALKALNLSSNLISDRGVIFLAGALEQNHVLETLDVSNNWISDRGVEAFEKALKNNISLKVLKLSDSQIINREKAERAMSSSSGEASNKNLSESQGIDKKSYVSNNRQFSWEVVELNQKNENEDEDENEGEDWDLLSDEDKS